MFIKLQEYCYFNFGLINGLLRLKPSSFLRSVFILNPKSFFYRHRSAKLNIKGRLVFGYPRLGSRVRIFSNSGQIYLSKNANLDILGTVGFEPGTLLMLLQNSSLQIGNNTNINRNGTYVFLCKSSIGSNCAIARGVTIMDSDLHDIYDHNNRVINPPSPVNIGNNVWIGENATILKGVTIGNNSIIGSGSVVTKSFPENSLIAGNPARLIPKNFNSWSHKGVVFRQGDK